MKTTSPELSEQLKKAGAKQESERQWCYHPGQGWKLCRIGEREDMAVCRAFNCDELLDGFPGNVEDDHGNEFRLHMGKVMNRYWFGYAPIPLAEKFYELKRLGPTDWSGTPAEALGRLKLWYLREGHCDE